MQPRAEVGTEEQGEESCQLSSWAEPVACGPGQLNQCPPSCWDPVLAAKCLSVPTALSRRYKILGIIGVLGSHNSPHSRFNLAASNSYLWR